MKKYISKLHLMCFWLVVLYSSSFLLWDFLGVCVKLRNKCLQKISDVLSFSLTPVEKLKN